VVSQKLKILITHFDSMAMLAGAALLVTAIGMTGAKAEPASSDMLVAATTGTTNLDGPPDGLLPKMRERFHAHHREFEGERPPIDKKLSQDQVRDIVAGHIAMSGNPNLKVGKVIAKEEGVVSVEIVTKTGALVDTREISTKTGLPIAIEEHLRDRMENRDVARIRDSKMAFHHRAEGDLGNAKIPRHDLALTIDQAKKLAEARLIMMGNKNLKVGAVKEKNADTISVDIVASDNSLVMQRLIDRHTGRPVRNS
jgi:hypothetical protein